VSKLIRKRHESSVTSVAWHPNNILLATTSTDGKCRVFSTFIKGVDTKDPKAGSPAESKFGEVCFLWQAYLFSNIHRIMPCIDILPTLSSNTREFFWAVSMLKQQILQLDLSYSWTFGVKWSPSGNTLAYVGHSSMIYFVDDVGPSPLAQSVAFRDLPLRDVLFISEKMVIGVGYDSNPMVFAADDTGIWSFIRYIGEKKAESSGASYSSQFSEAFTKFY
ncbi:hypothetical protein DY000_02030037, partial [Brassica cretica]